MSKFNKKWDFRFLEIAKLISTFSKDPSTKCGAVIVRPNRSIASVGFNGLPTCIPAANEHEYLYDREIKIANILHAEENALAFCSENLIDCCVYTFPLRCCSKCTSQLLQRGIRRFVSPKLSKDDERYERWEPNFAIARRLINLSDGKCFEYEDFK